MGEEEEGNGAAESIGDGKSGSRAGEGLIRKRGRPGPARQKKKKIQFSCSRGDSSRNSPRQQRQRQL